ncbi:ribosomal protein S18 acetylase RimI-like enzyme [Methanococcus voltae]|nr:GNAT family N-acetyltransferase [Methanococcus voltae]MCS3901878.1 ribosomal protein S18 acetylase RimI-like enzyme [Methanococcus voltae]
MDIWNNIVDEGIAFPNDKSLNLESASEFFSSQTYTGVAIDNSEVVGLYILHPNNVGRCGHIANSSYAVKQGQRGKSIGKKLVKHSLEIAKQKGFRLLQFNAVVASNEVALHLYKKLGFKQLGIIPGGFLSKDNEYLDIIPHYIEL